MAAESVDIPDDIVLYPTLRECLRQCLFQARRDGVATTICRAEMVGCDGECMPCSMCYVIPADDRRSVDEHVTLYQKGDA